MYAKVLVEIGVKNINHTFTYLVPKKYQEDIKIGIRVKVPFGYQKLEGFVLELTNSYDSDYELKEILELVDKEPVLNKEMLCLGNKISKKTLCSLISAYQVMLPKALKASYNTLINKKIVNYITLNKELEDVKQYLEECKYPKQIDIISKLLTTDKILITKKDSTIITLIKNEIIKIIPEESYRYNFETTGQYKSVVLNNDQDKVVKEIIKNLNRFLTYLLYGITGSGKTEVYMSIIEEVLNCGKSAIMLVPEISLTPQIVDRFITKFKEDVAILHSGLSDSERYDEYRKIRENKVKIVVGARSAIFAPFTNLGVIIIDEEHSTSYKQENHPRYHARDIALLRGEYHNCPIILGSATPSLESFARAQNKVYNLLMLSNRVGASHLPEVTIIDMKQEIKQHNYIFSNLLQTKIKDRIDRKEQVILLLNRRGYTSMITCSNCGYVEKCPNCDISLTYHKTNNTLKCHYCGYSKPRINICPSCHNKDLKDYGLGTEKLEEEIKKLFNCKVVRMDIDTTSKKGSHQRIIEDFGNHKYDILLGTQMIAKGLDFPLVTLVGVINADSSLNIPDFRSSENTFQLLSQVSGRAGRNITPGEVVIQTFNNDHYAIKLAKKHDYLSFYKYEMTIRKQMKYPPYYYLILVMIKSKDYQKCFEEAKKISTYLKKQLNPDSIILGPTMANMFKINNIFNFQCIIKYRNDNKLTKTLLEIDNIYKNDNIINVEIDVEPVKL